MKIAVLANDEQWKELTAGAGEQSFLRTDSLQSDDTADGYIILGNINASGLKNINKPVVINSVITTLAELNTAANTVRMNGWPGFLQRKTWEIAGAVTDEIKLILTGLNKQFIQVTDTPGLVAARPLAMIINEAYFALGEQVSTKADIDTAMKLGTNYPYGPFEWAEKIGIKNIYNLLLALSKTDKRYLPAPLLEKESA